MTTNLIRTIFHAYASRLISAALVIGGLICLPSPLRAQWSGNPLFYGGYAAVGGGFTAYWSSNLPGSNGIVIGAGAKGSAPGGGGVGSLVWSSSDTSNQFQAGMLLVTDPIGLNRRLKIFSVEQGMAYRNITLAEEGPSNVGIGTTNPQYKLSVAGTVQAYAVIVNNSWSDYVFAPNYRNRPLSEVAAYIKENHHLPEIPSAAEVAEKGISLGDMQAKLLAKVEELTLHMIDEHDRNSRLEQQNRELQERIARLEQTSSADRDTQVAQRSKEGGKQ